MAEPKSALPILAAIAIGVSLFGFVTGTAPSGYDLIPPFLRPEVSGDSDVPEARTYAEMGMTPRGPSSGLEGDLEPLRGPGGELVAPGILGGLDLERRAQLRAFEGAPPVIPHQVRQDSAPECLTCHGTGLGLRGLRAKPISHAEYASCTQCHVQDRAAMPGGEALPRDPRAPGTSFVGIRSARAVARVAEHTPPRVPHDTFMRERCQSCHGVNAGGTWHHPVDFVPDRPLPSFLAVGEDGRVQCVTCHKPTRGVAALAATTEGAPRWLEGSELCVSCHTAAHDEVLGGLGVSGGRHPGGSELDQALVERIAGGRTRTGRAGCLGCHEMHDAGEKGIAGEPGGAGLCGVCHTNQGRTGPNHPVGTATAPMMHRPTDLPTGPGGTPTCQSCHDLARGRGEKLLRATASGEPPCLSCHRSRAELLDGAHGRAGDGVRAPCLGCHDVHDNQAASLLSTGAASTGRDPTGCLSCHGERGGAAPEKARPGLDGHPVDGKRHPNLDGPLTCTSCHDAHVPDPSGIRCGDCHEEKVLPGERAGHGTATCADCHPTHENAAVASIAGVNPKSRRCLACHGADSGRSEIKKVSEYQHPAPMFTPGGARWEPLGALPLFGPDGQQVAAGLNGDLTCSTCHFTHGAEAPSSTTQLRRPDWKPVCAACHGDDAITVYQYFHQIERQPGAAP